MSIRLASAGAGRKESAKPRRYRQLARRGYQGRKPLSRSARTGLGGGGLRSVLDGPALAVARQEDAVALDHLVERRGLEAQQARRLLLNIAGGLERGLDQASLEVGDHLAQADALGRHADVGHVEAGRRAHVVGDQLAAD